MMNITAGKYKGRKIIAPDENITRPTRAGLLMFGIEHIICKEYPSFFLDYQDLRHLVGNQRWSNRITSMSGDWTGNIFDFFISNCPKFFFNIRFISK